jgi:tetratricopeptide (TPR) repeat protein
MRLGRWGKVSLLRVVLGSLPAVIAIYFLLTNDWSYRIGKLSWMDSALRWFAAWQLTLPSLQLNSNVVGGIIAAFMPMQVSALFEGRERNRVWLAVLLVGLSAFGLFLSESRGAWLALAITAGVWGAWELFSRLTSQWAINRRQARVVQIATLTIVSLVCVLILALTPLGNRLLGLRTDRLTVWRNSLDLASDYPFTGLGLGNFEMAYSSYVLLVQVPHTAHAHNLFLDIWLEQGLLGLLAFGALVLNAIWIHKSISRWRLAALASLTVILLHGLVDDAFYGYGGWAIPLLFLPLAVLTDPVVLSVTMTRAEPPAIRVRPATMFYSAAVILVGGSFFLPGVRAAFQANLGAVAQTQAELSVFHWPEWPFQDAVRRSPQVNLAPAIAHYQAALALDPANVTANRRSGQIELSFQQYDAARRHLLAAYAVAPHQRATRQLVGECYAIAGDVEQAAVLWKTIDVGQQQLQLREWWYTYSLKDQERAARVAQAAAVLNNY